MADVSAASAGAGTGRLVKAFGPLAADAGAPIGTAVVDTDTAAKDPVASAIGDFVTKPRSDAIKMTPSNAIGPYLALIADAPGPPPLQITIDGQMYELAADGAELAELVHALYVLKGWDSLNAFFNPIETLKFEARQTADAARRAVADARRELSPSGGTPERTLEAERALPRLEQEAADAAAQAKSKIAQLDAVAQGLRDQKELLVERLDTLLEFFYLEGRAELREMLQLSEAAVRKEVTAYGVLLDQPVDKVRLGNNDATKELRDSLDKLAIQRAAVKSAQEQVLETKTVSALVDFAVITKLWQDALEGRPVDAVAFFMHPLYREVSNDAALARQDLQRAQDDYASLRGFLGVEHPIIFKIAEKVEEKADDETIATAIYYGASGILESIRRTREMAQSDEPDPKLPLASDYLIRFDTDPAERIASYTKDAVDVWAMSGVIRRTLARLGPHDVGFAPGELGYVVITRVLEHIESDRKRSEEFWNDVSFVLPFLAEPTGGISLIVWGVISATRALSEISENNERLTLFNATLEPALALTDDDPSSFWLLVDLAFYGLDILEAGRAVRALAGPLSREARLKALQSMLGKSRAAKKLAAAEEKLVKEELEGGLEAAKRVVGEKSAQKVKDAVEASEKRSGGKSAKGAGKQAEKEAAAAKAGTGIAPPQPKSAAKAAAAAAANDVRAAKQLVEKALTQLKQELPDLAAELQHLLTPQDLEEIVGRISRFEPAATRESYEALLHIVQGELLERMVPKMPEFKEALENATKRMANAPGRWGEVRYTRIVEAPGAASGQRRKFSDFVLYAEGLDKDNQGFVLLLEFIEVKSGDAASLFRTVDQEGRVIGVGQLRRIEDRLRSAVWLDKKLVSFENMVYVLPTAGLEAPLTKYSIVTQGTPSWRDVGELVGEQRLNADVWRAPMPRDDLRGASNALLRALEKAPETKQVVGPQLHQFLPALGREAAGAVKQGQGDAGVLTK